MSGKDLAIAYMDAYDAAMKRSGYDDKYATNVAMAVVMCISSSEKIVANNAENAMIEKAFGLFLDKKNDDLLNISFPTKLQPKTTKTRKKKGETDESNMGC